MFTRLNKYGFTFIESLIAVACIPLILLIIMMMLKVMTNTHVKSIASIDILKVQLRQSLNRASNKEYHKDSISYDYNNQHFLIERDGERLVRRPGYEILLESCKSFSAEGGVVEVCNDEKCIQV